MNSGDGSKHWWQQELKAIDSELRKWLKIRLPHRIADHDDLVNETLISISQWINKAPNIPDSWLKGKVTKKDYNSFYKLAKVLLKRRIADFFRLDSRDWGRLIRSEMPQIDNFSSRGVSAEHNILLRRMLEITIGVIATLKPEERDVIAIASIGAPVSRVLDAKDRQRLSRARKKIATAIEKELGDSVANILSKE